MTSYRPSIPGFNKPQVEFVYPGRPMPLLRKAHSYLLRFMWPYAKALNTAYLVFVAAFLLMAFISGVWAFYEIGLVPNYADYGVVGWARLSLFFMKDLAYEYAHLLSYVLLLWFFVGGYKYHNPKDDTYRGGNYLFGIGRKTYVAGWLSVLFYAALTF